MLTTITPYWKRPEMLRIWLAALKGATLPGLRHLVFFIGENVPDWVRKEYSSNFQFYQFDEAPGDLSIGHYHNIGAKIADSEWMMKLDVDALPNTRYFKELLPILQSAGPREWFNGGMMYATENTSMALLSLNMMPLSEELYQTLMSNRLRYFGSNTGPAATNFICRTKTYLSLGGCDEGFRGYGWEDYQQIYMLERHERQANPLPGAVTLENVTRRCCRDISRPKARGLLVRSFWLALLHRFHLSSPDEGYKSHEGMLRNRQVLLDYIKAHE